MTDMTKQTEALREALTSVPDWASEAKEQPAQDNTYGYAKYLAEAMFKRHFASDEHYASGRVVWGVNDTVIGILTQIDNMVADMVRKPAQQEPVAHCEAGPEHCPVCLAETRSLALAAAVGYVQRNTPKLVSEEICRALKSIPTTAREWVGLTEFDIDQIPYSCSHADSRLIAYAIEAKLKEKNT